MSEDDKREIQDQLNRIERCLMGDEAMGQFGMVKTQRWHGKRLDRIERIGIYVAGAIGVVTLAWKLWTEWPH